MSALLTELIDKQDSRELVRDQIAAILKLESASQVALAATAGKPVPSDWDIRVFVERSTPWEQFAPDTSTLTEKAPIVNVSIDEERFGGVGPEPFRPGNVIERQQATVLYCLDCYGYGVAADIDGGGHTPADLVAALAAERTVRLVRNILMSAQYAYLGLRGLVGLRWVAQISAMQPPRLMDDAAEHVCLKRVVFRVDLNEFSPQYIPETLELLTAQVNRSEDGEILLQADFDYTS